MGGAGKGGWGKAEGAKIGERSERGRLGELQQGGLVKGGGQVGHNQPRNESSKGKKNSREMTKTGGGEKENVGK